MIQNHYGGLGGGHCEYKLFSLAYEPVGWPRNCARLYMYREPAHVSSTCDGLCEFPFEYVIA